MSAADKITHSQEVPGMARFTKLVNNGSNSNTQGSSCCLVELLALRDPLETDAKYPVVLGKA